MAPTAIYSEMLWLRPEHLSAAELVQTKNLLTITPRVFGDEEPVPVVTYKINGKARVIGLPPIFGRRVCRHRGIAIQERLAPLTDIEVLKCPEPWEEKIPGQGEFFKATLGALLDRGLVLAEAGMGTGKTACTCFAIFHLHCPTSIVVPTAAAADHWREELQKHNGFAPEQIGQIGDGDSTWQDIEGKPLPVVIMLLHSAAKKELPKEFFDYYTFNVTDEAHRLGAQMFSLTLQRFKGRYRLGLSGTPTRKDGCMAVVTNYFGLPSAIHGGESLPCKVRTLTFQRRHWGRTNPSDLPLSILINILSKDRERNDMLARHIALARSKGRLFLGIGDRIDQLCDLRTCLIEQHKLKSEEVGIFANQRNEGGRRVKIDAAERARVREKCTVILGTLGSMKECVDIPRMDAGMELTPVADGAQMIARIRRPMNGKKTPVWFTVLDEGIPMLRHFYNKRMADWKERNCELIDPV